MSLKISFYLKSGIINGEIPIIAMLNFGYKEFDILKNKNIYKPLKYYTGVKVEKELWDKQLKIPRDKNKSSVLHQFEKKVHDIFSYLNLKGEITLLNLKNELDEKLKNKDVGSTVEKVRIIDFIKEYILTSNTLKQSSKTPYKSLITKLLIFEKKIGKELYSNDLNEELYTVFMEDMKIRMNKINAVWAVDKTFRATLNEISRKYKIKVFNPGQELSSKDKVKKVDEDKLYLDFEQIQKIIDFEPQDTKLKNVKLIFLTLLFTGCRQSDVYKIKPQEFYEKNGIKFYWCKYIAEKTETEIIVPILKPLEEAYEKNDWNPPYPISGQKFNAYVKELAELSGLTDEVSLTYTDTRGRKQTESKKIYEFVTSHIGRRSFITNLIHFIPLPILTKITGHQLSDKNVVFTYNKISLLENAALFVRKLKIESKENKAYFPIQLV